MTPTGTLTNVAPGKGGVRREPATLSNHLFFQGSKAEMLRRSVRLLVEERRTSDAVRVHHSSNEPAREGVACSVTSTSVKPAPRSMPASSSASPSENGPGMPGGGTGRSSTGCRTGSDRQGCCRIDPPNGHS